MTGLNVLRAGLDTVVISYRGELKEEVVSRLEELKEHATAAELAQPVKLGLSELYMMPTAFGTWRWRLAHAHFSVVARRKPDVAGVIAQVRLSSFGLVNADSASLMYEVGMVLADLGALHEMSVSRADVCVDFQGWTPCPEQMLNIVCPAEYRATHGKESGVETYQFGKGNLLRVYNKTAELVHSKKLWLPELWGHSDLYDQESDVWRAEYQAKREVLRQLGIESSEQLFARSAALLDFGLSWAQMRVPSGANKSRWPEDPRWTAIREATFGGVPLQRRVQPSALMSLDRASRTLTGLAATAGAYFGTNDYMKALQQLSFVSEADMMREKVDFAALVENKRRRVMSGRD